MRLLRWLITFPDPKGDAVAQAIVEEFQKAKKNEVVQTNVRNRREL